MTSDEPVLPALPELQLIAVDAAKAGMEGGRMSYMETGDVAAEPVLLLHGIGSNSTGWRFVLDGLKERHRAIAWNAPGYYLSDNLAAETPLHTQYADALAAFLDALKIPRAHLVGSSFGSMIAVSFASRYPERVNRLVLSGTSRGQKWLSAEERARKLAARAESVREGGMALGEKRWANLLSPNPSDTVARLTKKLLSATHPRGMMQSARASDGTDVIDFAGGVRAPTLMVVGSEDKVNPPAVSEIICAAIPSARLVVLPNVGHLPKLETPQEIVAMLLQHFGA